MRRFDVTITDGTFVEKHTGVSVLQRNRLADFAFRHDLRCDVRDAATITRRTYR